VKNYSWHRLINGIGLIAKNKVADRFCLFLKQGDFYQSEQKQDAVYHQHPAKNFSNLLDVHKTTPAPNQ
jgi:hypothetical protein